MYCHLSYIINEYQLSCTVRYHRLYAAINGDLSWIMRRHLYWPYIDYELSSIVFNDRLGAVIYISCVSFALSRTSFHISYVSVDKELSSILHYHRLWAVWRCHLSSFTIHYESHPSRIIIDYDELSFHKL